MAVERRLTEIVGPVGGKVHTGRSRNDQVALDVNSIFETQPTGMLGARCRCVYPGMIISPSACALPSKTRISRSARNPCFSATICWPMFPCWNGMSGGFYGGETPPGCHLGRELWPGLSLIHISEP